MSENALSVGILFADVCGSVHLYDRLGDDAAVAKIGQCLSLLSSVVQEHAGEVIKTIGDEIMCAFPDATHAAQAAVIMYQTLIGWPENRADPVRIQIGMHFGDVIRKDGDIYGDAVNIAARMVSQAQDQQIITTACTVALLPPELKSVARSLGRVYIKGKAEEIEIFEIMWNDEDDRTIVSGPTQTRPLGEPTLELWQGQHKYVVNKHTPNVRIGRSPDNELIDDNPLASRHHVRIELRGKRFVLVDKSTNGTYVQGVDYQGIQFCHRDELILTGRGIIALGQQQPRAERDIGFVCRTV